ncbi:MAG: hypothetical protein ACJ741_08520 [Pyrinomonadaceae bacterium]
MLPDCSTLFKHFAPALYVDPGGGSLVWQLLLASFFGLMFYARKLRDLVSLRRAKTDALPDATARDEARQSAAQLNDSPLPKRD